ncbi:zinc finger CCCH domain-containing protein 66 [Lactuca sativa]|uniref:zinc finger CCCH domain-containing protein 66 n=1 Tax=Lactuca sativa TaxID=4236 RepID=UPI000CB13E31|nr:zinc finger CCCH domain-containing protein 66 [Lactuca sativa]
MCTGDVVVDHAEGQKQDRVVSNISILLELAAADDLDGFRSVVEQDGFDVNDSGLWYGRSIGSKKMRLEERTPLMIASMFGSKQVLKFILGLNRVDVNKACGSDRATALHMAVAGGSKSSVEVVKLLINASADISCLDVHGNLPVDLIPLVFGSSFSSKKKFLELLLNGEELTDDDHIEEHKFSAILISSKESPEKKEYPIDLSLPDMKNGIYNTDEFRMYTFKIKPCSRAYSHDWTECPFVHPGENARRRDPRKYHYSCVPCPEFRKGSCRQGDACEYAHGIFECWLHPAQYRTRLCKDEIGCNRKVCFFAHKPEELRPLHPSTGSAVLSPRSLSFSSDISSISPFSLSSPSIMIPPSSNSPVSTPIWSNQSSPTMKGVSSRFSRATSSRDLDLESELIRADIYRQQQLIDNFSNPSFGSDYFEEIEARINPLHQNMNYSSGLPSSPLRMSSQIMNSRSAAFAKRSQSFIDRGTANRQLGVPTMAASKLSDWGSPDGKLNWGIQKDELNKLRKSASFGVRGSGNNVTSEEDQYFSPWVEDQLVA